MYHLRNICFDTMLLEEVKEMVDYSKITRKKYIDFFTSEDAKTIERPNDVMDEFFCDMR